MIDWVRIAIVAAVLAAVSAVGLALRAHWVGAGRAEVQAAWNAQRAVDQAETLRLERERSIEQLAKFRNAERIADEQARREQDRARRDVAAAAVVRSLRSDIAALNRRDLSAAAGDPRLAALAEQAATARELLGSCAEAHRDLAAGADGLRDQVAGLLDDASRVCRGGRK